MFGDQLDPFATQLESQMDPLSGSEGLFSQSESQQTFQDKHALRPIPSSIPADMDTTTTPAATTTATTPSTSEEGNDALFGDKLKARANGESLHDSPGHLRKGKGAVDGPQGSSPSSPSDGIHSIIDLTCCRGKAIIDSLSLRQTIRLMHKLGKLTEDEISALIACVDTELAVPKGKGSRIALHKEQLYEEQQQIEESIARLVSTLKSIAQGHLSSSCEAEEEEEGVEEEELSRPENLKVLEIVRDRDSMSTQVKKIQLPEGMGKRSPKTLVYIIKKEDSDLAGIIQENQADAFREDEEQERSNVDLDALTHRDPGAREKPVMEADQENQGIDAVEEEEEDEEVNTASTPSSTLSNAKTAPRSRKKTSKALPPSLPSVTAEDANVTAPEHNQQAEPAPSSSSSSAPLVRRKRGIYRRLIYIESDEEGGEQVSDDDFVPPRAISQKRAPLPPVSFDSDAEGEDEEEGTVTRRTRGERKRVRGSLENGDDEGVAEVETTPSGSGRRRIPFPVESTSSSPRASSSPVSKAHMKKRSRIIWTPEQTTCLARGMTEYGTSWSAILKRYGGSSGPLAGKTQIQLKDKARNERRRLERINEDLGIFDLATL
ncbi:MAG: hypothetical protein DHS80DRAFT_31206 [Piptocephalis tieghemiana]|nr:MAG: hypothetical protein DHS80DRAFT_31206 [Piptocephalis tieghemiana]